MFSPVGTEVRVNNKWSVSPMNKKLYTLGTALVLALSLAACSKAATETTVPTGTKPPVTTAPAATTKPQEPTVPVTTVPPTTTPAPTESVPAQTENSTVNP